MIAKDRSGETMTAFESAILVHIRTQCENPIERNDPSHNGGWSNVREMSDFCTYSASSIRGYRQTKLLIEPSNEPSGALALKFFIKSFIPRRRQKSWHHKRSSITDNFPLLRIVDIEKYLLDHRVLSSL